MDKWGELYVCFIRHVEDWNVLVLLWAGKFHGECEY